MPRRTQFRRGSSMPPSTPPNQRFRTSTSPSRHVTREGVAIIVAVYRPVDPRDPRHWAIYIASPTRRRTIQQVGDEVGGRGYYVQPVRWGIHPGRATLHYRSIPVGTMRRRHVAWARRMIQHQPVDNQSTTWNCQTWVLSCLTALYRVGVLGRLHRRGMRTLAQLVQRWQ